MTHFRKYILLTIVLLFSFSVSNAQQVRVYSDLVEEHQMKPGETQSRSIVVENKSDSEKRVLIDLENYIYGLNREKTDQNHNRSLNNYISFSPSELRIPPNSKEKVNYRVSLPSDASGSYWSMLTVQPILPGDKLYASNNNSDVVIKQRVRWGINIVATAPDGKLSLNHLGNELKKDVLAVKVENNGTVSIRPKYKLQLFNSNGQKVNTIEGQKILMHPNTSIKTSFDLSNVKEGVYSGVVVIEDKSKTFGIRVDSIQL